MYQVHGMEFINTFLGFHNLTRFTTPEASDPGFVVVLFSCYNPGFVSLDRAVTAIL